MFESWKTRARPKETRTDCDEVMGEDANSVGNRPSDHVPYFCLCPPAGEQTASPMQVSTPNTAVSSSVGIKAVYSGNKHDGEKMLWLMDMIEGFFKVQAAIFHFSLAQHFFLPATGGCGSSERPR